MSMEELFGKRSSERPLAAGAWGARLPWKRLDLDGFVAVVGYSHI